MIRFISSLTIAFAIISGCFCDHQAMAAAERRERDEIYGSSFLAIQSAMEIFGRRDR